MASHSPTNGTWVKWVLGVIVAGLITFMSYTATNHVPRTEFEMVCDRLDRIEQKIDRLVDRRD